MTTYSIIIASDDESIIDRIESLISLVPDIEHKRRRNEPKKHGEEGTSRIYKLLYDAIAEREGDWVTQEYLKDVLTSFDYSPSSVSAVMTVLTRKKLVERTEGRRNPSWRLLKPLLALPKPEIKYDDLFNAAFPELNA